MNDTHYPDFSSENSVIMVSPCIRQTMPMCLNICTQFPTIDRKLMKTNFYKIKLLCILINIATHEDSLYSIKRNDTRKQRVSVQEQSERQVPLCLPDEFMLFRFFSKLM